MTCKEIRAEVERLKNDLTEAPNQSEIDLGRISAFEDVILLIDSHTEEPVSEDLEEAATNYAKSIAQFDLQRTYSIYDFKAGANWQKIQMMRMLMKSAVNGAAWEDFKDDGNKWLVINATGTKLRKGDEFKMIIIKEEEK